MIKNNFTQKIVEWYRDHKRILPWRETTDPYRIWISEIILQQTRVAQGFPYYLKFIERFPDVVALAAASEQEVLRFWQGLGYYTRARNLHRCAKIIVGELHGQFPCNFLDLQKLPGIGPYTAAAMASICFREPVAVVDGNVYRVLARVFGIEKDIATPEGKHYFFSKANELISVEYPDEFNQAMMEFGATWCLPKNPKCDECIFSKTCVARAGDKQTVLPVNGKKPTSRKRYLYYFVIRRNQQLALKKREGKDIWRGLYDFSCEETKRPQKPEKITGQSKTIRVLGNAIEMGSPSAVYKHVLSHQTLYARFIPVKIKRGNSAGLRSDSPYLKFYTAREIHRLPKPVLISRYLADIGFL